MKEFLTYLVQNVVKNPDDVVVEEVLEGTTYNYKITVNPDDMGLVIGKEGRIIRSIRALAKSKAIKEGVMINVELLEPEGSTRGRNSDSDMETAEDVAVESTDEDLA